MHYREVKTEKTLPQINNATTSNYETLDVAEFSNTICD